MSNEDDFDDVPKQEGAYSSGGMPEADGENSDDFDPVQEARWRQLFAGPDAESSESNESSAMDESFFQELQIRSTREFVESSRTNVDSAPSVHSAPIVTRVWVGLTFAASIAAVLWILLPKPAGLAPLPEQSGAGDVADAPPVKERADQLAGQLAGQLAANVGPGSCWGLRVAFDKSEESLTELLDQRMRARSVRSRSLASLANPVSLKLELEKSR